MGRLVKNELIKLFNKTWYIPILIFAILTVGLVGIEIASKNSMEDYAVDIDESIKYEKAYMESLDLNNDAEKMSYCDSLVNIDIWNVIKKYGDSSWQSKIIWESDYYYIDTNLKYYDNGLFNYLDSTFNYKEWEKKLEELTKRLDTNDWKTFAKESLENAKKEKEEYKEKLEDEYLPDLVKSQYNMAIENLDLQIQVLNWRLEKDICYGQNDYKLDIYLYRGQELVEYKYQYGITEENYKSVKKEDFKYIDKRYYQDTLSEFHISKYEIENNISDDDSLSTMLKDNSIRMTFVKLSLIIFAGVIVSEEFTKGTIKLLLIRPYTRRKIIISKLITMLIWMLIVTILIFTLNFAIYGVYKGFDTLGDPILVYNYNTNTVLSTNIMEYLLINYVLLLPEILIIMLLAFLIGTLFANLAVAIALPYALITVSTFITLIAEEYQLKWLRFIPTLNMNLSQYLYGKLPVLEEMTIGFSIIICIVTIAVLVAVTVENFARKDIKNI